MYLQLLVVGIAMGMIYALMAMGLILIVKAVGAMNFAHGELFMMGAYIGYMLTINLQLTSPWAFLVGIALFMGLGAIFMFTSYWPLRNTEWSVCIIISTMGISMALKEFVRLVWGANPLRMDLIIPGSVDFAGAHLEKQYLLIIVVSIVLISLVYILFEHMRVGRIMQAAAQKRRTAELLGVPTILTILFTFMISITLSGIGGWLAAPLFFISQSLGSFSLKAFAGIVVGGFGSIKGAVVGSLIVGILESYSILITSTYKDAIVFLLLIVVLAFRPQGLFGTKIEEKA